jgi:hypothetical protein
VHAAIVAALLCTTMVGCTTTDQVRYNPRPTFDDYVTAEIRTVGRYVLANPYPQWVGPPDDLPCEIGTIFGTHFDLIVPPVQAGSFLLVVVWSRGPVDGAKSDDEIIGRIVQTFTLPFHDPSPGTYLTVTLNEGRDLVAGRYKQIVTTGSGKPLFSHEFLVPECPAT